MSSMPALSSKVTNERLNKAGLGRVAVDSNLTSGFGLSNCFTNKLAAPTHGPSELSSIALSDSKVSRPSAVTIMHVLEVVAP